MMNKPIVLSSGEWLLPASRWGADASAGVCCSADAGESWTMRGAASIPDPEDRNCDEHMLVERQDGTLWMLVRTGYGIGESLSRDGGRTWSPVEPSEIEHPTSRFFIRRLRSGNLLLVKHGPIDIRTGRSDLRAFVSQDDGQSWAGGLLLDEREGVSYPDGVQADDGTIHVIYDYDRHGAKEILLAKFTENDASAGQDVYGEVERRMVVNKARGKSE
jgi:predicted neuraminidase